MILYYNIITLSRLGRSSNETHFVEGGEEGDVYAEITNRHQTFCFELNDFFYRSQMRTFLFEIKFV